MIACYGKTSRDPIAAFRHRVSRNAYRGIWYPILGQLFSGNPDITSLARESCIRRHENTAAAVSDNRATRRSIFRHLAAVTARIGNLLFESACSRFSKQGVLYLKMGTLVSIHSHGYLAVSTC